jgi:hypothetical protein
LNLIYMGKSSLFFIIFLTIIEVKSIISGS